MLWGLITAAVGHKIFCAFHSTLRLARCHGNTGRFTTEKNLNIFVMLRFMHFNKFLSLLVMSHTA